MTGIFNFQGENDPKYFSGAKRCGFRLKLKADDCVNTELGGFISRCIQVICILWTQFCCEGAFLSLLGFG